MTWPRALFLASLASVLCLTAAAPRLSAQEHPFQLSPRVLQAFERYMNKVNRGAFALSIDGRSHGYSFCISSAMCASGQRLKFERAALQSCQKRPSDVPCKIYAWRGNIVWQGDAPPPITGMKADGTCDGELQREEAAQGRFGWGSLDLTKKIFEAYEAFKDREGTGYFFVSQSSSAYGYHLCEYSGCDFDACQAKAQQVCQKYTNATCFLMADKKGLLWDGAVRGPQGVSLLGTASE